MQVILLNEVKNLGKKGEVKNVADGYALNFLLPRKLAVKATESRLNLLKAKEQQQDKKKTQHQIEIEKIINKLKKISLEIKAKAAESGKLFASITAKDIANELDKQKKIKINKKNIKLDKAVKTTGEHQAEINFGQGLKISFKFKVIKNS